jgi:hypothetical protein
VEHIDRLKVSRFVDETVGLSAVSDPTYWHAFSRLLTGVQHGTKFIQFLGGSVTEINTAVDSTTRMCGCCYSYGVHDLDICHVDASCAVACCWFKPCFI